MRVAEWRDACDRAADKLHDALMKAGATDRLPLAPGRPYHSERYALPLPKGGTLTTAGVSVVHGDVMTQVDPPEMGIIHGIHQQGSAPYNPRSGKWNHHSGDPEANARAVINFIERIFS